MMNLNLRFFLVLIIFTILRQCVSSGLHCKFTSDNSTVLSRPKRYLDFMKATRLYFRVNIRENVFTFGALWAHGSVIKAIMPILNDNKSLRPYRRNTYEVLQELLDFQGIDGQACLLKAFCTATRTSGGVMANGILFKLLRHIFTLNEQDRHHFSYLKDEYCAQILHHHCPLSFKSISPFTDI